MKNIFKLLGIIALVAIIGFSFAACDNGDGDKGDDGKKEEDTPISSFAGTWNASGGRSIVFSGSTFTYKVNGTTTYSGTFSVSGSTITFNAMGLGTASGNFQLAGEALVLSNHTWDSTVNGTYTKDNGTGGGDVETFLNGKWAATNPNRNFVISGNTWTYYESNPDGYSKGTWSSTVTPAANTTGTITLTITQINSGGWTNLPAQYESVKTNTATFTINAAGNQMTITNPTLTTDGVWGTLAGTYTKDSGSVINQTPVAGDYTVGNLNQTAGRVTAVTISPINGKSTGTVFNVKYNGNTAVPQTAGTYAVTFDVATAVGWNEATGLYAGNLIVTGGVHGGINYSIGDYGPGGGIIFYVDPNGFTMTDTGETCYYLEAATVNQATSVIWASATANVDTESAIGTGRKNTATIRSSLSSAPAAKACTDYRGSNNLNDWYLPSQYEIRELYKQRTYFGKITGSYWSSTQPSTTTYGYAYHLNFDNGSGSSGSKNSIYDNVRAIRAFGISSGGNTDPTLSGTIIISPSADITTGTKLTATYNGSETITTYQWKKEGENVGINSTEFTPTITGNYNVTISAVGYKMKISAAVTVSTELTYKLGDTGPGGGVIFHVDPNGFTITATGETCHYLEAAPETSSGLTWASSGYTSINITGTAEAIGAGKKNTALILSTDANAPAAKFCADYRGPNNFNDWYLPSKDELNKLWNNKDIVNFASVSHWTSSQSDGTHATKWQRSSDTYSYWLGDYKNTSASVRPIRAFKEE